MQANCIEETFLIRDDSSVSDNSKMPEPWVISDRLNVGRSYPSMACRSLDTMSDLNLRLTEMYSMLKTIKLNLHEFYSHSLSRGQVYALRCEVQDTLDLFAETIMSAVSITNADSKIGLVMMIRADRVTGNFDDFTSMIEVRDATDDTIILSHILSKVQYALQELGEELMSLRKSVVSRDELVIPPRRSTFNDIPVMNTGQPMVHQTECFYELPKRVIPRVNVPFLMGETEISTIRVIFGRSLSDELKRFFKCIVSGRFTMPLPITQQDPPGYDPMYVFDFVGRNSRPITIGFDEVCYGLWDTTGNGLAVLYPLADGILAPQARFQGVFAVVVGRNPQTSMIGISTCNEASSVSSSVYFAESFRSQSDLT